MDLQEYNFTIKHRPGKTNTKVDLLSQRTNYPRGDNNNKDIILLKEELFQNIEICLDEESYHWLLLQQEIVKTHRRYFDKQVQKGIKDKDPNFIKDPHNGTWEWKGQIYIPARKELREKVIQSCHKVPTTGHPGVAKTLELITRGFWWLQMRHDIKYTSRHVILAKWSNLIDNHEMPPYNQMKCPPNHGL